MKSMICILLLCILTIKESFATEDFSNMATQQETTTSINNNMTTTATKMSPTTIASTTTTTAPTTTTTTIAPPTTTIAPTTKRIAPPVRRRKIYKFVPKATCLKYCRYSPYTRLRNPPFCGDYKKPVQIHFCLLCRGILRCSEFSQTFF